MKNRKSTQQFSTKTSAQLIQSIYYFLHLLNMRGIDKNNCKENICEMFEQASILKKVNILREFFKDDIPYELELKNIVSFCFQSNTENISLSKIYDIVEEMYIRYIKNIIQDVVYSKVGNEKIVLDYYRAYHFYDLLKREDFTKDCTIEVPEDTTVEGIINLVDFVTLRSGFGEGYDGEQMATSKRKSTLFLPALRVWFDSHSVSSLSSAQIDRWIGKCEASISYRKDDKTGLNKLHNYTGGAEEVKEFLEELKETQSSARL